MLLTKQHLVNTVDDRWKKQYFKFSSLDYYMDYKIEKYKKLVSLGENKKLEDVNKIIGNSSWIRLICNHCDSDVEAVFVFGSGYESLYVCEDCLGYALNEFGKIR